MAYSTGTTLLTSVSARTDMSGVIRAAAVLFVAVLTAVAAQVSIPLPFTPVPFTLQPMIVLVGAAALGARLGMASQVIYLLAGIAGLPVFATSAVLPQGFLRLLGPTGGFLMAYPLAAFVAGWLAERGFDRVCFRQKLRGEAGGIAAIAAVIGAVEATGDTEGLRLSHERCLAFVTRCVTLPALRQSQG